MNIKQASEYTGISRDMIRFYEKKGIIHPARKNNGYRDYSSHDLLLLVTARQYSCLGIELDTISELLKQNDPEVFYNEMEQAVSRLKEEQLRLLQQMDYAENMKSIFRMASEGIDHEIVRHGELYYYPRTDVRYFADLYAYNSARPAFLIRNENLELEEYPQEQGMLFLKPVGSKLTCTSYQEGTFMRFLRRFQPDIVIGRNMILPMIRTIESEGYRVCGDVFISMVLGDSCPREEDLSTVEFEISER